MTAAAPAVLDWGRTAYAEACERQRQLVDARLQGLAGDTLVFTEHDPVYTVGLRTGAARHVIWSPEQRAAEGIELVTTNRGGDITYHGPGQIVGYPIVDLSPRRDLHAYLRFLEDVLTEAVAAFGIAAGRREGLTGIWIGTRKVAAIGVAVRRWIAYHGFALNVAVKLPHFSGIVPCGIASDEGTVTSLERELGRPVAMPDVQEALRQAFLRQWPGFIRHTGLVAPAPLT